jgi:hypothetical protein
MDTIENAMNENPHFRKSLCHLHFLWRLCTIASLFFVCLLILPIQAQDNSTASLDETIAWLKARVEQWGNQDAINYAGVVEHHKESLSYSDSGIITLHVTVSCVDVTGNDSSTWVETKANLADFETNVSITLNNKVGSEDFKRKGYYFVSITAKSPIVTRQYPPGTDSRLADQPPGTAMGFDIIDQASAERFAKALQHAIELAKKKDPFP